MRELSLQVDHQSGVVGIEAGGKDRFDKFNANGVRALRLLLPTPFTLSLSQGS
jgi:hypothetical protein